MVTVPIEERLALQDLMIAYCYAVDKLDDVDDLVGLFTDDAVLDFSAIGLPLMHGHAEIRRFFERVFADMSHHAHYISNFRLDRYNGESASMRAYVVGLGRSNDGNTVDVKVRYTFDTVRTGIGWKASRYIIEPMMPMPESLNEIHGDH